MEKAILLTPRSRIKSLTLSHVDRVYIGDAECEFNCVSVLMNKSFTDTVLELGKPITIITSHITEKPFITLKHLLKTLLLDPRIDELVVNDLGVLSWLQNSKLRPKIIYGNYLFSQSRDPIFKNKSIPRQKFLSIDSQKGNEFLHENAIEAIEISNSYNSFELKYLDNIALHIHYPYVVHTMGRYCHRSLLADQYDYLKLVDACNGCLGKEKYSFYHTMNDGQKILKRGNKSIYTNFDFQDLSKVDRIVYNYDFNKS